MRKNRVSFIGDWLCKFEKSSIRDKLFGILIGISKVIKDKEVRIDVMKFI